MQNQTEIVAFSQHPSGNRLATAIFHGLPYRVIQELATHRKLRPQATIDSSENSELVPINPFTEQVSRNSESSRAVPIKKAIEKIMADTYVPQWRSHQKGMQGGDLLPETARSRSTALWLEARDRAIATAQELCELGVCKQDVSAVLLPFMRISVIATATVKSWQHFIKLRADAAAHPDLAHYAYELADQLNNLTPKYLNRGDWHIPLITDEVGRSLTKLQDKLTLSAVRCARISYGTEAMEKSSDLDSLRERENQLKNDLHLTPFEHQVKCVDPVLDLNWRNLEPGWVSQRSLIEGVTIN
jgi:thymidylate synthase ThyX